MQSKSVKELHSNFVNFIKCDGDIKYMTLTDLLSLLKKNELETSILEIETQRLIISNIYECICGDNGDLQDLSLQCLPYITIQFNGEEIINLSLKLCKHLQCDLPPKKDDEEKYNNILRQSIVITNCIKSMCKANNLFIQLSLANGTKNNKIPTPTFNVNDSPLLLPQTPFTHSTAAEAKYANDDHNNLRNENITQLIESLSSLLLNIIACKQQSMRIEFKKHATKQQHLLSKSSTNTWMQNEIIISFEHYHQQILFALDILATIIDNHGKNVSFIFDSATNVLLQLLSGAHHNYSAKNEHHLNAEQELQSTQCKLLESKQVNKKAIECLGSLSRFLANNELKMIINTLCDSITKCMKNREYSTLKNLFNAVNKISNDYKKNKKNGGLSAESVRKLCLIIINVIGDEEDSDIKKQIEIREYGFMALETLIKNSVSSNIIALFMQFLSVLSNALSYDPNYNQLQQDNEPQNEQKQPEEANTGWTDDDDDDSWGNNDDDDGFINDGKAAENEEDLAYFSKLDELNQNLEDDDDDSWKVRRSSNKCLLAMINILINTRRDFNPNMFRLIKERLINKLLLLLNRRCCERVLKIKLNVFNTYNTLLVHLIAINSNPNIYITLDGNVLNVVCAQINNEQYLNEVVMDIKYNNNPQLYHSFFHTLSNILLLYTQNYNALPPFIDNILPLCISTMSHYQNDKWNEAITAAFQCCCHIYNNDTDHRVEIGNVFDLSIEIGSNCTSNEVLEAMYESMAIIAKYLDAKQQEISLKQCIERLQERAQQQQNVINSTVLCLTGLISNISNIPSIFDDKSNIDFVQNILMTGLQISDELMTNEVTRLTAIKLSIACIKCIKSLDLYDEKSVCIIIKSIVQKLSLFLKQNSLNVRFLSLNGLLLTFNKYPELCAEFQLSMSELIALLKHTLNESCDRLKDLLSVIIYLFDAQCMLYNNYNLKNIFNVLQIVTNSNAIHPVLFPLWTRLFCLLAHKMKMQLNVSDDDELIALLHRFHDKLIQNNMILSSKAAKYQSCCCAVWLLNEFVNIESVQQFFMQFTEEEEKEDINNNRNMMSKEINRILIGELVIINKNNNNKILNLYHEYVSNAWKQCVECKTEILSDGDGLTSISSCYLLAFITDSGRFVNILKELSRNQPRFALNTLAKVIENYEQNRVEILCNNQSGIIKIIQFIQCTNKYFNESATVLSHLLCHKTSQKETFNAINSWLNGQNNLYLCRLGMESLTSALITSVGIAEELLSNSFSNLITRDFISNVMSLINSKDLNVSLSALKNIKFLVLARIKTAIQNEIIDKLLLILLNRTKSSADYIEKISFGPITKLIDKSACVRSLAFEIIADIIEYNNNFINLNGNFLNLCIEQLIDAIQSNDSNVVNYACQSFQILIKSGFVQCEHITKALIQCITKEIEGCKKGTNENRNNSNNNCNKLDSNKKEKLGHLLHFYGVIRKSISNILSLNYINTTWNSISSLINQIEQNPSFLIRTPSMIYNENMDIGQPLLLSPSLRSHSISSLQRQNSLQYLEPFNNIHVVYNHANNANDNDTVDVD